MTHILDTPVEALPLPVRVRNVLLWFGECSTLRDVLRMNEAQIVRLPNFGKKSLRELKDYLSSRGLRLADAPPPDVVSSIQSIAGRMHVARERYREGAAQLRALLDSGVIDLPSLMNLLEQYAETEADA